LRRRDRSGGWEDSSNRKLVRYLVRHGDDLSFTKQFWKRCEPNAVELKQYIRYVRALVLRRGGVKMNEISSQLKVNHSSIHDWVHFQQKPKLSHYLDASLRMRAPRRGWAWISISNTPGHAIPLGPFIMVPLSIGSWNDVRKVLAQTSSLSRAQSSSSAYKFGFLLGVMIGDAAKKKQRTWHRYIELVLSKRYSTSLRIGDFTTQCARAVAIRMRRMKDQMPHGGKPNGFYVWRSQSSAFVDWLFNVCLGLKDGQLTTYSSVKMNWAFGSPREFRIGLIQGLAESDGSVNIAAREVEFWIGPSWDFVSKLLATFGIRSFRSREALTIAGDQVIRALRIPIFSPYLRTVRYQKFEKLARAKRIPHGHRIPKEIRMMIAKQAKTKSVPWISEAVLDKYGVVLTYETVQRWSRRPGLWNS
jgi:hypothetical protein